MLQIVVLERGWVLVGSVTQDSKSKDLIVNNAHVVRRWGTTKGLGQLALEGPQKETKLDRTGFVSAPNHAVIFRINCDPQKWGNFA